MEWKELVDLHGQTEKNEDTEFKMWGTSLSEDSCEPSTSQRKPRGQWLSHLQWANPLQLPLVSFLKETTLPRSWPLVSVSQAPVSLGLSWRKLVSFPSILESVRRVSGPEALQDQVFIVKMQMIRAHGKSSRHWKFTNSNAYCYECIVQIKVIQGLLGGTVLIETVNWDSKGKLKNASIRVSQHTTNITALSVQSQLMTIRFQ